MFLDLSASKSYPFQSTIIKWDIKFFITVLGKVKTAKLVNMVRGALISRTFKELL